jgi:SpoVK/Ycf46/Vps4 family AAA+-type ATPase
MAGADEGSVVILAGMTASEKRMAVDLVSREVGLSVDIIDPSQIVSKYIGETEKNLFPVFTRASQKGWILFFDEADALFGKRTAVKDSHDRYANMEVSHLAELAAKYGVTVVLAFNDAGGVDTTMSNIIVVGGRG